MSVKTLGIISIVVGSLVLIGLVAQFFTKSEISVSEDGTKMTIKSRPFGIGISSPGETKAPETKPAE